MAIKAIVFDLWNTLAYNVGSNPVVDIMNEFNITDIKAFEESFMKENNLSVEEAMFRLCKMANIEPNQATIKRMLELWQNPDVKIKLFDDVLPVIKELKKKYKLGLISNTDHFYLDNFKGFFDLFDVINLSCDVGILKPDPEIFELMLDKLKVKPEQALMVGDNLSDDIGGSTKVGMRAILLKREGDCLKSWREDGEYSQSIKDLNELLDYLKNG